MDKVRIELTEQEMRHLAELCAMGLTVLGQAMPESRDPRVEAWHRLMVELLKAAKSSPAIARDMEFNPDCGYWFFKRPYIDKAFYSDVMDEYRDAVFWEELVARMATQSLAENMGSTEEALSLPPEEQSRRTAAMEKALWNEVTRHGIDRLMFLLPEGES